MNKNKRIQKIQRNKKLDAVEKFGGKCCVCGYDKCINALEFHHLTDKKISPAYIIMRWKWEKAIEELKKCVLMCANCHREAHYKVLDLEMVSQKATKFLEKTCIHCSKLFDTRKEDQKFCSYSCVNESHRKVPRPTKDELRILIENKKPFMGMGKMFGVTDTTVRKWARSYGLI